MNINFSLSNNINQYCNSSKKSPAFQSHKSVEKLIEGVRTGSNKKINWSEFIKILSNIGYEQAPINTIKGSARAFINSDGDTFYAHQLHNASEYMRPYMVQNLKAVLEKDYLEKTLVQNGLTRKGLAEVILKEGLAKNGELDKSVIEALVEKGFAK